MLGLTPPLPVLAGPGREDWLAQGAVQRGESQGFRFAQDAQYLFFSLEATDADMAASAEDAYTRLQALLAERGMPHLLRVWNYFSRIHEGAGDAERYHAKPISSAVCAPPPS